MTKIFKQLVKFNAPYYSYPNSVRSGKYLLNSNLSTYDQDYRTRWLEGVVRLSHSDFHRLIIETFTDLNINEILPSLLSLHGVFVERFFHQIIHERVVRRFAEAEIDLEYFQRLISIAWGYNVDISNKSDAVFRIIDHIFEQTVVHNLNDPFIRNNIQVWFDEFSKPISCILCGNTFRSIDLPDWIYFGSNGYKYCCFQCNIVQSPKKSELTCLIPAFVEKCGFIPNSAANPINFAFTSRLSTNQWADVFIAYAKMGGIEHAKMKFDSWFKALSITGALPDGVLITARGIRCLAKDGHACHSLDEQQIDNWLSSHQVDHEREPIYPSHTILNPYGKRRGDWKVQDTFIEYFGLVGDQNYEKKMNEKIFLAQQFNVNLIAVYPSDLSTLDQRLKCLLE